MHINSDPAAFEPKPSSLLESLVFPKDLRDLMPEEMEALARELREYITHTVSRLGGHLASNLGVVELTLALHRVYDAPKDKILFDVGHQCYTHKILTGRLTRFDTLRQEGGISGFPLRSESEYDVFGTGHASTAASAALGFARARDMLSQNHDVVAVVGDGALTGGEAYEAFNDAGHSGTPLVIVLNDNGMSIATNVGALTRYLTRLRVSRGYWRFKDRLTVWFERVPRLGEPLYNFLQSVKNGFKYLFFKGRFFDALGFVYLGPVDGHDIWEMEHTLRRAKSLAKPVLVHVVTRKGKGVRDAEDEPQRYHGVPGRSESKNGAACAVCVSSELKAMAQKDLHVCAITAAMPQGTGLESFANAHPNRFYDVGIAEEHAATLCAALAAGGMRPYFAVYSTFFQRCFDQAAHDIALQGLSVIFLLDRSGLVGEDGATHHGVYDIALLLLLPGFSIFAPRCISSLRRMLELSLEYKGPLAIRYPKSLPDGLDSDFTPGCWETLLHGERTVILGVGPMVYVALEAARNREGVGVISVESISPLDMKCLYSLAGKFVLTLEEGTAVGGFGALLGKMLEDAGIAARQLRILGTPRKIIPHASIERQRELCGLNVENISRILDEMMDEV